MLTHQYLRSALCTLTLKALDIYSLINPNHNIYMPNVWYKLVKSRLTSSLTFDSMDVI